MKESLIAIFFFKVKQVKMKREFALRSSQCSNSQAIFLLDNFTKSIDELPKKHRISKKKQNQEEEKPNSRDRIQFTIEMVLMSGCDSVHTIHLPNGMTVTQTILERPPNRARPVTVQQ